MSNAVSNSCYRIVLGRGSVHVEEGEPTDKEIEAAGDAWIQQQAHIGRGK